MDYVFYLSDFKIKETSVRVDIRTPFVYEYFVYTHVRYIASFDGENYVNCARQEDGSLHVFFNNHNLGSGRLRVERKFFANDTDFSDGLFNIVTLEHTGITLSTTKTGDIDFESVFIPPYIKGAPMEWETMTDSERGEMLSALSDKINSELIITDDAIDETEYDDVF